MALLSVVAITGIVYALREVMPATSTGVLYMLAVLLVSSQWGLWLGLATSVASALAFFEVVEACEVETATQLEWLKSRMKEAAPQGLVVAP